MVESFTRNESADFGTVRRTDNVPMNTVVNEPRSDQSRGSDNTNLIDLSTPKSKSNPLPETSGKNINVGKMNLMNLRGMNGHTNPLTNAQPDLVVDGDSTATEMVRIGTIGMNLTATNVSLIETNLDETFQSDTNLDETVQSAQSNTNLGLKMAGANRNVTQHGDRRPQGAQECDASTRRALAVIHAIKRNKQVHANRKGTK